MDSIKETNEDLLEKLLPRRFHFQVEAANNEDEDINNLRQKCRGALSRRALAVAAMSMLVTVFFVLRCLNRESGNAAKGEADVISLIQARSPSTAFHNITSPQRRALDWLLSDEFTQSQFDNDDRVVQRFALAVIYYATGGIWSRGGLWLEASAECHWEHEDFWCNHLNQVTYMELYSIHGSLPRELGLLSGLTFLDLGRSTPCITGAIPSEIGLLSSLRYLRIQSVELEAPFPTEIGMLSQLEDLSINGKKKLAGMVPTELGNLSNLDTMFLGGNQLTGSIPFPCDIMHNSSLYVDCSKIFCGGCCHHDDESVFLKC